MDHSSPLVRKSVKRGVRVLHAWSARASHARRACEAREKKPYFWRLSPVSLSVFSPVPDLSFDCSRLLEYAKIRTVLQSIRTLSRFLQCPPWTGFDSVPEESLSLDSFEVNLHFSSNESQSWEQGQVQTIVINTNEISGVSVLTTSLHY